MSGCQPTENKNCADVTLLHLMRQTIETWQKGYEELISDLIDKVKDIVYRLDHIDERVIDLENIETEKRLIELETLLDVKKMQDIICDGANLHATIIKFEARMTELESRLNKINDMLNLEDRITSLDVLNRLTLLENSEIQHFKNYKRWIEELECKLGDKISELDSQLNIVRALGSRAYHPKKPFKCPVCEGKGKQGHPLTGLLSVECHSCEGKGVLWG